MISYVVSRLFLSITIMQIIITLFIQLFEVKGKILCLSYPATYIYIYTIAMPFIPRYINIVYDSYLMQSIQFDAQLEDLYVLYVVNIWVYMHMGVTERFQYIMQMSQGVGCLATVCVYVVLHLAIGPLPGWMVVGVFHLSQVKYVYCNN